MNLNYADKTTNVIQIELYFAEKKTGSCFFMQINISPLHLNLAVFLNWIAGCLYLATLPIRKSKNREKTTETAFHKRSANRCFVKLSKIHRKVTVPESHVNVVTGIQRSTLLRKRPRHSCFPVITLPTRKFLMTF